MLFCIDCGGREGVWIMSVVWKALAILKAMFVFCSAVRWFCSCCDTKLMKQVPWPWEVRRSCSRGTALLLTSLSRLWTPDWCVELRWKCWCLSYSFHFWPTDPYGNLLREGEANNHQGRWNGEHALWPAQSGVSVLTIGFMDCEEQKWTGADQYSWVDHKC